MVITGDFESLDAGSNPAGELVQSPVIVTGPDLASFEQVSGK